MKTASRMIGLIIVCTALWGCSYSVGPWEGHLEEIERYDPVLVVVEEEAKLELEPSEIIEPIPPRIIPQPQPKIQTQPSTTPNIESRLETEPEQALTTKTQTKTQRIESEIKVIPQEKPLPRSENEVVSVIESISKMESNSTKRRLYIAIAKRDDLTDNAQVALVNSVFDTLFSETAMEDVLITMIQNKNFSSAGNNAIVKRVDDFFSESSKKRILSALPNE